MLLGVVIVIVVVPGKKQSPIHLCRLHTKILLASTVCKLITFRASKERVASDDTLPEITNTGGILNILTKSVSFTISAEGAATNLVFLSQAHCQRSHKYQ